MNQIESTTLSKFIIYTICMHTPSPSFLFLLFPSLAVHRTRKQCPLATKYSTHIRGSPLPAFHYPLPRHPGWIHQSSLFPSLYINNGTPVQSPLLHEIANDQSDVKRPVSPPAGGAAASAYSVNRPHGANAVRYVNSFPPIIVSATYNQS
jgi:hypothetical protein